MSNSPAIAFGQHRVSNDRVVVNEERVSARFVGTNVAPVVDPSLLQKTQPWGANGINHIDIDGHHGEFSNHIQEEAALWERKLQSFVSGAYTQMDFGSDYSAGRNELKRLFQAVESEEKLINGEHRQVIDQNNTLIAKSKELTVYNNRLYGLLNDQSVELAEVARLRQKHEDLLKQAETAGLVETVEEENQQIGDHHETGRRVQVQHIYNGLESSSRTSINGFQQSAGLAVVSGGNQIGSQSVIGGGSQQRASETLVSGGNQFGSQSVIGGGSQQRVVQRVVSGGFNQSRSSGSFVESIPVQRSSESNGLALNSMGGL